MIERDKSHKKEKTAFQKKSLVFGEQFIILNLLFCSAVPTVSKVMITTGSPRTNAAKTEIINVDYGYAGGPCKGYRTFQPRNFKPRHSTPEFSTPNFSTMNLSTPDSYWDEEFMVEKPEVEK